MCPIHQTNVVVLSDHPLFRDALVSAIEANPRFRATGVGSADAPASAELLIIDFDLDVEKPSAVVQRLIHSDVPSMVLLSASSKAQAYELIEGGAGGVMDKSCTGAEIVDALQRIAEGDVVIPKSLMAAVTASIRRHPDPVSAMSKRELEILEYSAEGLSATAIGKQLGLSESTIKSQLSRIYDKLNVTDRAAAVAVALRRSIIH